LFITTLILCIFKSSSCSLSNLILTGTILKTKYFNLAQGMYGYSNNLFSSIFFKNSLYNSSLNNNESLNNAFGLPPPPEIVLLVLIEEVIFFVVVYVYNAVVYVTKLPFTV